MKRRFALIGLAMLVPVQYASGAQSPCAPAAAAPTGAKGGSVVAVAALMSGVDQYRGTIRVEGLVRKVFPKEQKLGLIDATEFRKSGMISACCANQILPVQWSGPMPEMKSVVLMEGEIRKVGDKFEFAARSLEKVALK
jgi:hypothetical protein